MKKQMRNKSRSTLWYMSTGIATAIITFSALAMILAAVLMLGDNPTAFTGIAASVSLVVSFFVMGLYISIKKSSGGTLMSLVCALLCALMLLAVELILKSGSVGISFIVNCLCSVAAALVGSALTKKRRRRRT